MTSTHRIVMTLVLVLAAMPAFGQTTSSASLYRVFLKTGEPLASFGEAAMVGDRVVFNVVVRDEGSQPDLQLISLPIAVVDVARTSRYADAMHAAYYAATRGEADYDAVTAEVSRALDVLASVPDPRRRLELAQQARERLLAWSRDNYRYRERDIRVLSGLFEDVIAELRASVGQSRFSLDLVSGPSAPTHEALLSRPTNQDLVTLALSAASATDVIDERLAVLRLADRAVAAMDNEAPASELRLVVAARLREETRINDAYAALGADLLRRGAALRSRGDVAGVLGLRTELDTRDRQLGSTRPEQTQALARELSTLIEATRAQRLALDHAVSVRPLLAAFELRARPALTVLDGLAPVLQFIRDGRAMAYGRVVNAEERLADALNALRGLTPPLDAQGFHTTLVSALTMAREACARRRQAVVTNRTQVDREASSAAAGALMLTAQFRRDVLRRLNPPRLPVSRVP